MSTETDTTLDPVPRRRRRKARFGWWMLLANLIGVVLLVYVALALSDRSIPLPDRLAQTASARISAAIAPAEITVGRVALDIGSDGLPGAELGDITIRDGSGSVLARLTDLDVRLSRAGVLTGEVAPRLVRLGGAQVTLRRDASGAFAWSVGGEAASQARTTAELVRALDSVLGQGPLSYLETVEATDVTVILEDARSGRIWQALDADLEIGISDTGISASLLSDVFNGTEDLAQVQVSLSADRGSGASEIAASLRGVPSADLALQSPALSFLSVLKASINGSVRAALDGGGQLRDVSASFDIAGGAIEPQPNARYPFDQARAYLAYDPARSKLTFSDISMQSDAVSFSGSGHAYLRDLANGWPRRLEGQIALAEARISDPDRLASDVTVSGGWADLDLALSPFALRIGELVLETGGDDGTRRARARGAVRAQSEGWGVALDFSADRITPPEVLAFWPVDAIKGTRAWVAENVLSGGLSNVRGGIRVAPGSKPDVAVAFDFSDAEVRFMRHFPTITGGRGRASFEDAAFTMYLADGAVDPGRGGAVDLSGSTFRVSGFETKPARAEIGLETDGTLEAALALLDNRPFEILKKSGLAADIARARAVSRSEIALPIKKKVTPEEVSFRTSGTLTDLTSEALLPGRLIASDRFDVTVDGGGITLQGRGTAGGVPVDATWLQAFGPEANGRSRLAATLPISSATLEALGIRAGGLALTGEARADLSVELARGAPADFLISSDLVGLGARLAAVGWSKDPAASGELSIAGTAGDALTVSELSFSAPGLSAAGRPLVAEGGRMTGVDFDRVRIGRWFDGRVRLASSGPGAAPRAAILGGRLDLAARPRGGAAGQGGRVPLDVTLDELVISETIALRPFTARIPGGGAVGQFEARVNGASAVRGEIIPQQNGTAFRMQSDNAGGVLSDARILKGATGGTLTMALVPGTVGAGFEGELAARDVILKDAPAAARLLDSASIVGLLDELRGSGIRFDTLDARFRIGPDRMDLYRAAAIGPSLGISLDGTFDTQARVLDMQGVVSPFYIVNGIGSLFTRQGEGLFGMTFRMAGPAASPGISVNPLSILTPGTFRDIFRRPPPTAVPRQ